jgi:hypothetical protein
MKSYIDNLDKIYEILNITDETNIIRNKTKKSIFNEYDRQIDPYHFSLECSHTDCFSPLKKAPQRGAFFNIIDKGITNLVLSSNSPGLKYKENMRCTYVFLYIETSTEVRGEAIYASPLSYNFYSSFLAQRLLNQKPAARSVIPPNK